MPPKAKFTKEEIVNAALEIVGEGGMEVLTARTLGKRLGSSSCPVFTVFESMEEVKEQVLSAIKERYEAYVKKGLSEKPAFKGVGRQYILFAIKEPKFFRILFMTEQEEIPDFAGVLPQLDENYDKILASIQEEYGVGDKDADKLYRHLWIYTHGIATLCATKMCRFREEEINDMLTEVFVSLLRKIKGEKSHD